MYNLISLCIFLLSSRKQNYSRKQLIILDHFSIYLFLYFFVMLVFFFFENNFFFKYMYIVCRCVLCIYTDLSLVSQTLLILYYYYFLYKQITLTSTTWWCPYMCIHICMCVCYIYIYICVCVCMCIYIYTSFSLLLKQTIVFSCWNEVSNLTIANELSKSTPTSNRVCLIY